MNTPPDETIQPQSWLAEPRGDRRISLIVIHATRGETTQELQYSATKNWLLSPDNKGQGGDWGSATNRVISHEGQMCICWPDDMSPRFSAGFGFNNTDWAIDWHAISFELAQSNKQEKFSEATITRAVREVALLCRKYGIDPIWLDHVDQTGPVLSGITGHENTDNGKKLGKTDPGKEFDSTAFVARVRAEMGLPIMPGGPVTPPQPSPPVPPPEPEPVPPPSPPPVGVRTHVVERGETLWRIATHYYQDGKRWPEILAANEDKLHGDERRLADGMEIRIP